MELVGPGRGPHPVPTGSGAAGGRVISDGIYGMQSLPRGSKYVRLAGRSATIPTQSHVSGWSKSWTQPRLGDHPLGPGLAARKEAA
jgi:hypothetical protein